MGIGRPAGTLPLYPQGRTHGADSREELHGLGFRTDASSTKRSCPEILRCNLLKTVKT